MAASSIARSRRSRKSCASTRGTATRSSTCRSSTRSSDQWADALRVRGEIAKLDGGRRADDQQILAFLTNEIGTARARNGDTAAAGKHVRRGDRYRLAERRRPI